MRIETIHHSQAVVVVIDGEMDNTVVSELHAVMDELVASGVQNYVIDLSRVTFMDSSGLAALASLYRRIRIGNGDVRLCNPPADVRRIMELTRFDRVFEIYTRREDAIASFGPPE